jgi:hypothetical protein
MRQPAVDDIVKAIAADTSTPTEVVEKMYREVWEAYSKEARVTDYMPVLVAKRVREDLRNRSR